MALSFNYKDILNGIIRNDSSLRKITHEESENLKKCLFEMAVDLDERCRKHGIHLILIGGSLLGGARHKGFIPWDDDMDFGLIRPEYEKMKAIFDEEFGDQYMLRCPNSPYPNGNRFMQIYKKGTVLKTVGEGNPFQPQTVYIDIFPYDYVPDNTLEYKLRGYCANALMFIASCVMSHKYMSKTYKAFLRKSKDGRVFIKLREVVGVAFSFRKPEKWFDSVDNILNYKKKTNRLTAGAGRRHYFGETYSSDVFLPLTELSFEDHFFYAPGKYKEYLVGNYGDDWTVIPEEEKRESHFITEIKI